MKKPLKIILILVIVTGLAVGGIAAAYYYNRSSTVAKVAPLNYYAMSEYYGDQLSSSGEVTSDESQVVYISSSDTVLSVDVNEGDTVSKGDLLFTLEVQPMDVTGKELAIRGQEISLNRAKNQLEIYKNTTPVPDAQKVKEKNITKILVTRELVYTGPTQSITLSDGTTTVNVIQDETVLATEYYASTVTAANKLGNTYYYDKLTLEDIDESNTRNNGAAVFILSTNYKVTTREDGVVVATEFYDEDGKLLGTTTYDYFGNLTSDYNLPVGYTAQELSKLIKEKEYEVKTLDLALRKAYNELETMKRVDTNGKVFATMDGVVTKLQDPNNLNESSSFITVAASNEYFIRGYIGEFDLDTVHVGDTCSINNWQNGTYSEATIVEIDDFSTSNGNYWSQGNTNVSPYGFKAVLSDNSACDIGDYVEILIGGSLPNQESTDSSFYIEKMFLRKDEGGYYLMKMDETQHLKKVYLTCGKTVWGSYIQILAGDVTMEDYIAFPYKDGNVEGAKCEVVDNLYNY